ncbi:hypothetical protein H6G81_30150 [Scytonema hofmannii FACHB-248]|uniref:Uncharacterized protein n=1 Tax=Scytonema hofmannii FACHB-248 TaxID=1842502 RepID=A0ABR8GZQ8_9CYAN|nr:MULTISPECIES: hypothetical protein [Nostocales]MBD2608663.1 hypothetical protein [Scytonema hofmannii FACHB-248]
MQQNSTTQTTNNNLDLRSHNLHNSVNNVMGALIIMFPIMLFVGVKAYKGYRVAVLRKRIATLEKLWHLDVKNNKF